MKDKVLIIEDSASFAEMLKQHIQAKHPFDIDVAQTLNLAKKTLKQNAKYYFCAVVDLTLPDALNGEAVDEVVALGIPVLVFTGTLNQALEEDLWVKGISDYAHKSGFYNLDYIAWKIKRLHANGSVEIVVVDDSVVACKSMTKLLRSQRFRVHPCKSAEQALEAVGENPNIRVVITDCNMHGMSGLELTSALRETYSREELEIIGVSSGGGKDIPTKFIKHGANDFLHKPFAPEEFHCRVNSSVDRIETYLKLKELNQLKNQFLGTAAHDIRGPIASIKAASNYLIKRDPGPERSASLLQMISESSDELLELLNSLLDISAIESGQISLNCSKLDLCKMADDRVKLYQNSAEDKNITIETQFTHSAFFEGDKIKIMQVIDNLITNAIKYSPPNSTVWLSVCKLETQVTLEVSDSGPGIDVDQQKHMFKPFHVLSTKTTAGEKATGLGLTITKTIVEAHHGEIQFTNLEKGGARFTVVLPCAQPDVQKPSS